MLWTVARLLLVLCAVALGVATFYGMRPVTNPGVQQCGSPAVYVIRNTDDVRIPPPGSPDEPPGAAQLRAQPRCRELVDAQLGHLLVALGIGIGLGLLGAALGVVDDRLAYRRAPRFESYLRERPSDIPTDPWDQPIVPVDDLGVRLPEIEWREVRTVVALSLVTLVALPLLAPWSAVRAALDTVSPTWVAVAVLLVALTYPVAAAGVLAAIRSADGGAGPGFVDVVEVGLAASVTGRLLPEYGPPGLTVHQLVRAGMARSAALRRISALRVASLFGHGLLLVVVAVAASGTSRASGSTLKWGWVAWIFAALALGLGLVTARRRYRNLVVKPDRAAIFELRRLLDRPGHLASMAGSALGLALVDGLVVVAAVHAFGAAPALLPVLLASLVATVAGVLAATPDGCGVVEIVLTAGLVSAGVDAGPAVAAALLTRLVRFWLPMVPGWVALRRLRRADVI